MEAREETDAREALAARSRNVLGGLTTLLLLIPLPPKGPPPLPGLEKGEPAGPEFPPTCCDAGVRGGGMAGGWPFLCSRVGKRGMGRWRGESDDRVLASY